MRGLLAVVAGAIAALSLTFGTYVMLSSPSTQADPPPPERTPAAGMFGVVRTSLTVTSCDDDPQGAVTITFAVVAPRDPVSFRL